MEDSLPEGMAANCRGAAESAWTEDPGGLQSEGSERVGQDPAIKHTHSTVKRFFKPLYAYGVWHTGTGVPLLL